MSACPFRIPSTGERAILALPGNITATLEPEIDGLIKVSINRDGEVLALPQQALPERTWMALSSLDPAIDWRGASVIYQPWKPLPGSDPLAAVEGASPQ
jgi:hypothetical protein